MLLRALLPLLASAALAIAAPTEKYHGVSLRVRTTDASTAPAVYSPAPVEINHLTSLHGVHASQISFDGIAPNVDINKVECRAYRDVEGLVPLGGPFTNEGPGEVGRGALVEVGSVICYVVE